jgi:hypothetical protein
MDEKEGVYKMNSDVKGLVKWEIWSKMKPKEREEFDYRFGDFTFDSGRYVWKGIGFTLAFIILMGIFITTYGIWKGEVNDTASKAFFEIILFGRYAVWTWVIYALYVSCYKIYIIFKIKKWLRVRGYQ